MERISGYGYAQLVQDYGWLLRKYRFMSGHTIGRSVLGRPIVAIRCGSGPRLVHMNASFHANEWMTSALLMRFLDEWGAACLTGAPEARLYREVTLWAVPMVNPDGVELSLYGVSKDNPYRSKLLEWNGGNEAFDQWKANIRGVDLNDQFPAHWEEELRRRGTKGPSPRDYPGPYPLSEPEARALAAMALRFPFDTVLALHTQGKEIYWNYRDYEPPYAERLADRLGRASGYKPVKLSGSDAGFKDWFIQCFRKPGFTIEAGEGVNPLPYADFPAIYGEVRPLLLEALRLHDPAPAL
ncbi:M14 family metallocarboxypeptidase [Paenibacillus thailandensis]|uniref:M14 family metallocarboxypeptidase n=1 Tax=Paenibacillus thailandensis TaxID=393250 RepID=A0ABW5R0A3_9BACL